MARPVSPPRVDRNTLRTNQAFIVGFTVLAFVLGAEVGQWIILGTALVMLLGTFDERLALFKQVHRRLLKPAGVQLDRRGLLPSSIASTRVTG